MHRRNEININSYVFHLKQEAGDLLHAIWGFFFFFLQQGDGIEDGMSSMVTGTDIFQN